MTFRITGLQPAPFATFFGQSDAALARAGVIRHAVTETPGVPDRITLTDLAPGDTALLLNYEHLPVDSPYRSRHAIYVKEGATAAHTATDTLPDVIARRTISLRAIDGRGHIVAADLAPGRDLAPLIADFLARPDVAYLHAHFAQRGCFAARIDRG